MKHLDVNASGQTVEIPTEFSSGFVHHSPGFESTEMNRNASVGRLEAAQESALISVEAGIANILDLPDVVARGDPGTRRDQLLGHLRVV